MRPVDEIRLLETWSVGLLWAATAINPHAGAAPDMADIAQTGRLHSLFATVFMPLLRLACLPDSSFEFGVVMSRATQRTVGWLAGFLVSLASGLAILLSAVDSGAQTAANAGTPGWGSVDEAWWPQAGLTTQTPLDAAGPWPRFEAYAAYAPENSAYLYGDEMTELPFDAEPLGMALGDIDDDSREDLVIALRSAGDGWLALHRGNRQSHLFRNQEHTPFLSPARLMRLPVVADFVALGDFDNDAKTDIAVAAMGDDVLYWFGGDGQGNFTEAVAVPLNGMVTAAVAGQVNRRDGLTDLVLAVMTTAGPELQVFQSPDGALREAARRLPLPERVDWLLLGELDAAPERDIAAFAGDSLYLVSGVPAIVPAGASGHARRGRMAAPELYPLPFAASGGALRRGEVSLWSAQGELLVASLEALAAGDVKLAYGLPADPSMPGLRAQLAHAPGHELLTWSGNAITAFLAQPDASDALALELPGTVRDVQAGLLDGDGLRDLVVLTAESGQPMVLLTRGGGGIEVNSTADTADPNPGDGICDINDPATPPPNNVCTLRGAIQTVNAAGGGTIVSAVNDPIVPGQNLPSIIVPTTIMGENTLEIDTSSNFVNQALRVRQDGQLTLSGTSIYNDNLIIASEFAGPVLADNIIQDNRFGVTHAGQLKLPTAATLSDTTGSLVRNNLVNGGISIQSVFDDRSAAHTVSDNVLAGTPGDPLTGELTISLDTSPGSSILDNIGTDMIISDSSDVLIDFNQVGLDAGGQIIGDLGGRLFGIQVAGLNGNGATVTNNQVGGQDGTGITVNVDQAVVRGNSSRNNNGTGIVVGFFSEELALVAANIAQGNMGRGLTIGASNSLVVGNTMLNNDFANFVAKLDGNLITNNLIADGNGNGAELSGGGPAQNQAIFDKNTISDNGQGNPNSAGLLLDGVNNAIIEDNSIDNNNGTGVTIRNFATRNMRFRGNDVIGNSSHGVNIIGGQSAIIGGPGFADGNFISGNGGNGIQINGPSGFDLQANIISKNAGLGIDLNANGIPDANDAGDGDGGANGTQNFPVIVSTNGGVSATLNSTPDSSFRIDAYDNVSCDTTGFGEGGFHLATTTVTTDANGNASINFNTGSPFTTLTATRLGDDGGSPPLPVNSTSEFSQCQAAAPLVVNSDGDADDAAPGDNACFTGANNNDGDPECTLRAAIQEANARPGFDLITFAIPLSHTLLIRPGFAFDVIAEGVNINATSQPNGRITIDGTAIVGPSIGLHFQASDSLLRGLNIAGFASGVILTDVANTQIEDIIFTGNTTAALRIQGAAATLNGVVENRFIDSGIAVELINAPNNTVAGNTVLGSGTGVSITGQSAGMNMIGANDFGLLADGTTNGNAVAISIDNAPDTVIDDNVIVASSEQGIKIDGALAAGSVIQSNLIGTDRNRRPGLGNGVGIFVNNAPGTRIGGDNVSDGNEVVASIPPPTPPAILRGGTPVTGDGVILDDADQTIIERNFIGITKTGVNLGNARHGIDIDDSAGVVIGGSSPATRNTIAHNGADGFGDGVQISGRDSQNILIAGNYIGVGLNGLTAAGNASRGIDFISAGPSNRVEGEFTGNPQIISGNGLDGIRVFGNRSVNNQTGQVIIGNNIGTDLNGSLPLANGGQGILLEDSENNLIEANIIGGNTQDGIRITDDGTNALRHRIEANQIGVFMTTRNPNGGHGISVADDGQAAIGAPGADNRIVGNTLDGINIAGDGSLVKIDGNMIFDNGLLGINLVRDGEPAGAVTPNDSPLDNDSGPNSLTNFPQDLSVTTIPATGITTVRGQVFTEASEPVSIQLYSNDACDSPSGHGEGQRFEGAVTGPLETDANGRVAFTQVFSGPLLANVTATLTLEDIDITSEFSACLAVPPPQGQLIINEIDAAAAGTEYIELFHTSGGAQSLSGHAVVLFDGSNDQSYAAFDLDGLFTNADGYFVLGDGADPFVDLAIPEGLLQDGADAVALYSADAVAFPNGTPVTGDDLLDALVYDSGQDDDSGLLVLLNPMQPQINEAGAGDLLSHSSQRCPDGAGGRRNTDLYAQAVPTPGEPNACVVCSLAPADASRDLAETHSVTARVLSDRLDPVNGVTVDFEVISGPNNGTSGAGTTDADGMIGFDYSSQGIGVDSISANGTAAGNPFVCTATVEWLDILFADGFEAL